MMIRIKRAAKRTCALNEIRSTTDANRTVHTATLNATSTLLHRTPITSSGNYGMSTRHEYEMFMGPTPSLPRSLYPSTPNIQSAKYILL